MIWWVAAFSALVPGLLWAAVHEGAHATAAKIYGRTILSFKPWPHKADGRFHFGRVVYSGAEGATLIHIAPYLLDLFIFVPALLVVLCSHNTVAQSILFGVMVCPVVNTGAAVQARYRGVAPVDLSKVHWGVALVFFYLEVLYLGAVIGSGVFHG